MCIDLVCSGVFSKCFIQHELTLDVSRTYRAVFHHHFSTYIKPSIQATYLYGYPQSSLQHLQNLYSS
jgi:hypothetical protein